jgi:3D (Asp-Asp-Asp) domain-containing protein
VGLEYLRARWYDAGTGRFTSEDLWEGDSRDPLTLNPYLYVLNNPVNLTDPTGRFPTSGVFARTGGVCPEPAANPRRMPEFVFAPSYNHFENTVWVYCGDFGATAYQFVTQADSAGNSWYANVDAGETTVTLTNGDIFNVNSLFLEDVKVNGTGWSPSAPSGDQGRYFGTFNNGASYYYGKGRDFDASTDAYRKVAADPEVLQLGAEIYVPELEYGPARQSWGNAEFTVADTGGDIQGNRIDVFVGEGPGLHSGKYDDCPSSKYVANQYWQNGVPEGSCSDHNCLTPVGVYEKTFWPYTGPCGFGNISRPD